MSKHNYRVLDIFFHPLFRDLFHQLKFLFPYCGFAYAAACLLRDHGLALRAGGGMSSKQKKLPSQKNAWNHATLLAITKFINGNSTYLFCSNSG
jgi:hypothetical protein